MTSPTQLSLKFLRAEGWLAEVVEKWIPGANIRKDLWGWCDILALQRRRILAVQTTTAPNMAARERKIRDSVALATVLKAGIEVEVHGWHKVRGVWRPKTKRITSGDQEA